MLQGIGLKLHRVPEAHHIEVLHLGRQGIAQAALTRLGGHLGRGGELQAVVAAGQRGDDRRRVGHDLHLGHHLAGLLVGHHFLGQGLAVLSHHRFAVLAHHRTSLVLLLHGHDLGLGREVGAGALGVHGHGDRALLLDTIQGQLAAHLRGHSGIIVVDLDETAVLSACHVLAVGILHVGLGADGDHFVVLARHTLQLREAHRLAVLGVHLALLALQGAAHIHGDARGNLLIVLAGREGGVLLGHGIVGHDMEAQRLEGGRTLLHFAVDEHPIGVGALLEGQSLRSGPHRFHDDPVVALGQLHVVATEGHLLVGGQLEVLHHHRSRGAHHVHDNGILQALGVHREGYLAGIGYLVGIQVLARPGHHGDGAVEGSTPRGMT